MGWFAGQNGIPESRIVRFMAGAPGFVVGLASSLTALLATNVSPVRVPFEATGALRPFLGYDLTVSPQISDDIITAATRSSSGALGYFSRHAFQPFVISGSAVIGAFKHTYVDGDTKTRILKITAAGQIVDAETDTNLTRTGTFFASPTGLTYAVSDDGKVMIAEDTPTLNGAPFPPNGAPTAQNVRRVDIDFMASPQVTWSTVSGVSPYGTDAVVISSGTKTATRTGSYAGVRAPAHDGTIKTITIDELVTAVGNYDFCFGATLQNSEPGISQPPIDFGMTRNLSSSVTGTVTLKIPDGIEQAIPMMQATFTWDGVVTTGPGATATITIQFDQVNSALGIIYADPQHKFLLYELNTLIASYGGTGVSTWIGAGTTFTGSGTTVGTARFKRTVGVLYGDTHRVLHVEESDDYALDSGHPWNLSGVLAKTGFPIVRSGASVGLANTQSVSSAPPDSSDSTPFTYNAVFFKQLKCVHTPHVTPTELGGTVNYIGGLDRSRLFPHDVSSPAFNATLEPRFWVGVRSPTQWMVAMHRRNNLNVAADIVNDFQVFSGPEPDQMKQRFITYLLDAANSAPIPNAALIATLNGGEFGTYDIIGSSESRIPIV